MKLMSLAHAWALVGCLLLIGDAMGQGLRQPISVRPAGFDYSRYLQEDTASPSDQPAAAESAPPAPAAEEAGSGVATAAAASDCSAAPSCGCPSSCDDGCDSGGCDSSCCDSSCRGCSSCCGIGLGNILSIGNCCLGDPWTLQSLMSECSPITVGGWTQIGYHDEDDLRFNDRPDEFNLHQQWFYIEKAAKADCCCWDWGFRADLVYGIDGPNTQAFGNTVDAFGNPRGWDTGWDHGNDYGYAIPQLYAEVAYGNWSMKAGHFYTLVGYEVVPAPDNFFYSHAFTMNNSEPFTHTGVVSTYTINDCLQLYSGWTLGWDTGFDQFQDGSSFLGGFSASLTDDVKMTYIVTAGDFGWRGDDGYMHSIVLDMNVTDKLNWVVQSDLLRVDSTLEENVGINQYLLYTINDCLRLGTRLEWWKTDPNVPPGFGGDVSVNEVTFGVNYRPHANVVIRPEVRETWVPAIDLDETTFGIDAVITY